MKGILSYTRVNTSINKILVIVNSSIYNQLSGKIERYAYDINYIYGCEVIMETVSGGDRYYSGRKI